MKKYILFLILLLNLLPVFKDGQIEVGMSTASAQRMGNEGGDYYICDDEEIGEYVSYYPCDQVICIMPCPHCDDSFPCDEAGLHECNNSGGGDEWEDGWHDGGGSSTGGGGGSSSGGSSTGGSSQTSSHKKTASQITNMAKSVAKSIPGTNAQCSEGVRRAFKNLFGKLPAGMNCNANSMVKYWMNNPSLWQEIAMSQAQGYANQGYFVVAGWINPNSNKSGHVVVIVPGTESKSSWGSVPKSMDTGGGMRTPSQPLSYSFGKDKRGRVKFFMYK